MNYDIIANLGSYFFVGALKLLKSKSCKIPPNKGGFSAHAAHSLHQNFPKRKVIEK